MSLELINTLGTVTTVVIVAAAAIAALVQLRHLRAGNQINAMLSIGESLDKEFLDAQHFVQKELAAALKDPDFRAYSAAMSRGVAPPEVPPVYVEVRRAAIAVGNKYEELGILVRNGIVDPNLFIERYAGIIGQGWSVLETFSAFSRAVRGTDAIWENFEYLAVLAQDWLEQHPEGIYPKGVRRIQLHNPWPVPPMPATA
jgi:hypothetical protein